MWKSESRCGFRASCGIAFGEWTFALNPVRFTNSVLVQNSPEALWILNPRKILKKVAIKSSSGTGFSGVASPTATGRELEALVNPDGSVNPVVAECFICYDGERQDAGQLIYPCSCKGDVSAVHHDCLKQWLMESNSNPEAIKCKGDYQTTMMIIN